MLKKIICFRCNFLMTDDSLLYSTCIYHVEQQICKKWWRRNGHIHHKPDYSITRQASAENPQEKRKRGRPQNTWCHDLVEADVWEPIYNWKQVESLAQDWNAWQNHICGPWFGKDEGVDGLIWLMIINPLKYIKYLERKLKITNEMNNYFLESRPIGEWQVLPATFL